MGQHALVTFIFIARYRGHGAETISVKFNCDAFYSGLGSWPNIDQAPAPELTIFKSLAPASELVFRFMRSQLQSSFLGFTNVVKCNIFLAMDFTDNITIC